MQTKETAQNQKKELQKIKKHGFTCLPGDKQLNDDTEQCCASDGEENRQAREKEKE